MKKLLFLLVSLSCLTPGLVFADAGGAGQGAIDNGQVCASYSCVCMHGETIVDKVPDQVDLETCTTYCGIKTYKEGLAAGSAGAAVDIPKSEITPALQCLDAEGNVISPAASTTTSTPAKDPILPCLNVPIPGLKFGNCDESLKDPNADANLVKNADGETTTNLLGSYVEAVYQYLLIAAAIVAVTMLMIAGLQYATARGSSKQVDQAKKRINNAIVGIILLLLAYNIAFIINPATTTFESLSFISPAQQQLNRGTSGPEGDYGSFHSSGTGTWENLSGSYKELAEQAHKQSGACNLKNGFASPVQSGNLPNQTAHHWGEGIKAQNYQKVTRLDWAANWGDPIYAPVDAVRISYKKETKTKSLCGNQIILITSANDRVTVCHAKDFIGAGGTKLSGPITQGTVIGHLGGKYCITGTRPQGWYDQKQKGSTPCDPEIASSSCDCQPYEQAGNSTGPHVHVTMESGPNNILACLK